MFAIGLIKRALFSRWPLAVAGNYCYYARMRTGRLGDSLPVGHGTIQLAVCVGLIICRDIRTVSDDFEM